MVMRRVIGREVVWRVVVSDVAERRNCRVTFVLDGVFHGVVANCEAALLTKDDAIVRKGFWICRRRFLCA